MNEIAITDFNNEYNIQENKILIYKKYLHMI